MSPRGTAAVAGVVALLFLIAVVVWLRRGRGSGEWMATRNPSLATELRRDVEALCAIGPRNTFVPENLAAAADLIEKAFAGYAVERQAYVAEDVRVENLVVEIRGTTRPEEIVIVGAHYDSVDESPGADDNASGVAAMLALARRFANERPARTLRFVAWTNEEPPHFQTGTMGSYVYARRCKARNERIVAALSLEMLGYYDHAPGSQQYPPPLAALYPDTADFIGFAGNLASRALVSQCVKAFRARSRFPAQAAVLPELIPQTGWSDQWSFWQFGWPALMVTDTALYRNPHYHTASDTPETLDYERMAAVVDGLVEVVSSLVSPERAERVEGPT
ncbi:MAG: M20/M25/M40 family metallo-hydrolase [Thermoanaerobaculia bacterium]